MNSFLKAASALAFGATALSVANAADVPVSGDITVDTTWTADNVYDLVGQVIVRPGATLTIEAGTVVASDGGSLAVTKGAQIFVNGTANAPVVMTSKNDVATWTAGDPTTGSYRQAANEWGNLTLMGAGYISEDATPGNTSAPSAANVAEMEGLIDDGSGFTLYGGGDDNDDSGSINYLSLRYGGNVVGLNNELNGLSLGGIGRGTDINFVEILNNVDDGIEIWGGAVQLKNYVIWNVGDDSFDVDQGWRGKAQFGLVVQGYSTDANQGSGVGDNAYEIDGSEDSDWQPRTRATIYNTTVIGQPLDGDGLTTWRDGAGVQYRNSLFIQGGEQVIKNDGDDGDGASGYGFNGTASFASLFSTPATTFPSVNPFATGAEESAAYASQVDGNVSELRGSVFFQNFGSSAYTELTTLGLDTGFDNIIEPANSPIQGLERDAIVNVGNNKDMLQVNFLNPLAANDALVAPAQVAPNDGFFTPANYRGAFDATNNWAKGWTGVDAFGFFDGPGTATLVTSPNNDVIPGSLTATAPNIGQTLTFTVDNPTGTCGVGPGSLFLIFIAPGPSTLFPFAEGGCGFFTPSTVLINPLTLNIPLSLSLTGGGVGVYAGAPVNVNVPIPFDVSFIDKTLTTQVGFFENAAFTLRLGEGQELTIGQ